MILGDSHPVEVNKSQIILSLWIPIYSFDFCLLNIDGMSHSKRKKYGEE